MKNLIFTNIVVCFFLAISFTTQAQINESFFETLGTGSEPNPNGSFGITSNDHALLVKIADSNNTEVQFARYNYGGNYELFSAHLPSNNISPKERIIQLFESGNSQFLITNDSLSYAPRGIRIHKFLNYTQNAGYFEYPTSFSFKNAQAYLRSGKIYIFFVDGAKQLKRLTIDANSLLLDEQLVLASHPSFSEGNYSKAKSIHVDFHSSGDMTVYANAGTELVRVNVVNNVPTMETRELKLKKVIGIDTVNNRLICLKKYAGFDLYRYELNADILIDNIQAIDSLELSLIGVPSALKDWHYATDGVTEFFEGHGYLTVSQNQIIARKSDDLNYNVTNCTMLFGYPMAFGAGIGINSPMLTSPFLGVYMTYGQIDELFKGKEYAGVYKFGNVKTRIGTGNSILSLRYYNNDGDHLFRNQIWSLGQHVIGRENGIIKGTQNSAFQLFYKPGPYTAINKYSQEIVSQYNENFYIDLTMLNQHVASVGNPNYVVPRSILNWPAHGNPALGQAENLAPFKDLNNNGTYEPLQGEYPVFPGTHCLLNITHQHELDFNGEGSGLELHTYMYNFDCEDTISEVIFVKTEIYNRGQINYDSLATGIFADTDLGGAFDDFCGTNVENGLIYSYNGDDFDGDYEGNLGFGDSLPTVGVMFLKGNKIAPNNQDDQLGISQQSVNGYGFGDGIIDNEFKGLEFSQPYSNLPLTSQELDPSLSEHWFNVLNGLYRFGDTMYYGNTSIPARFSFPDNSDPLMYGTNGVNPGFNWSETNTNGTGGSNPPGDRRILGSFGSTPLAPGNKLSYDIALLSGKRVPGAGQSQIDLFAKAKSVRKYFQDNLTACGQTFGNTSDDQVTSLAENKLDLDVKIYPNPFSENLTILVSAVDQNSTLTLFDLSGKKILSEKISTSKHVLSTSMLEKGIYFLRIENAEGTAAVKIVKN